MLFIVCSITVVSAFAGIKETLLKFAAKSSSDSQAFGERLTLDSDSESCLRCHNGTHASRIIVKHADAPLQIWDGKTINHPIGMLYDQYQGRSPNQYIPQKDLNPNIKLTDGRVGCRSCHAMKTSDMNDPGIFMDNPSFVDSADCPSSDQLTVSGTHSALCLSCHIR